LLVVGYSGTPLATKLGIRDGSTVALLGAPADIPLMLPSSTRVKKQARGRADVVLAFVTQVRRYEARLDPLASMVFPSGSLWIAWPKRSSGVTTDMTDDAVRRLALARGLVDNKVCAVDDVWTALRLVWRRELRTPEHPA
jgi:hypothetical protein